MAGRWWFRVSPRATSSSSLRVVSGSCSSVPSLGLVFRFPWIDWVVAQEGMVVLARERSLVTYDHAVYYIRLI